jgi:hypothetical protein
MMNVRGVVSIPALAAVMSGCLLIDPGPANQEDTDGDDVAAQIEEWNRWVEQLDARRTEFFGPRKRVQDLAAVGTRLFWYDTTNFDFRLASYDSVSGTKLAYTFAIGAGDLHNYRASPTRVLTADPSADPVAYHLYDVSSPQLEQGSFTMKKSPGTQWSAYAVTDTNAYVVDTSVPGETLLKRWSPGQELTDMFTLESTGAEVGEFWDFGIDEANNSMVFLESRRIWYLDLTTKRSTWLKHETEARGHVDFRPEGVMFDSASGIMFFNHQSQQLENLTAKIDANPYVAHKVYKTAAKTSQLDFAWWSHYLIYIGQMGVFAYDMAKHEITPLLLAPAKADLRIDYRYPVALENGKLFVVGLTSTSGSVGADGPTYEVDLKAVLD